MLVGVQNPVTDDPSSLTFQFSQPDRRMPVMRADYFIPTGWRFGGLSNLDDAMKSDGVTPATSCNDIFASNGQLQNAEGLSAATGMHLIHGALRNNDQDEIDHTLTAVLGPDTGTVREYGVRNPGGSEGSRYPSVAFLNWDGTTANLCYYHRNNAVDAAAREFRQSATLTRLAGDPNYDWKLSLDVSSVLKNSYVRSEQGSVLKHDVTLGELTIGNWNRDETTGEKSQVQFARTPATAGNYTFRGEFSTCAGGLDNTTATGCRDIGATGPADDFSILTRDQLVQISPPANNLRHDFGVMTGPLTADLCDGACNAGLVLGEQTFTASWQAPVLPAGSAVKGYVLVLAEPGDQASRVFQRIITNPAFSSDPDYNASVCATACSLPITFPLQSSDGSTTLLGDGKYHMSLVTLYTDSIRRSDGLCDNPTGTTAAARASGVSCPVNEPRIRVTDPGKSNWQVLMRPDAWPDKWIVPIDSGEFDRRQVLNNLLLLDWGRKRGEFIIWNNHSDVTINAGSSNLIQGTQDTGGLVFMSTPGLPSASRNWVVSLVVDPITYFATGLYLEVDLKNPGLSPPTISGYPEVAPTIIQLAPF